MKVKKLLKLSTTFSFSESENKFSLELTKKSKENLSCEQTQDYNLTVKSLVDME